MGSSILEMSLTESAKNKMFAPEIGTLGFAALHAQDNYVVMVNSSKKRMIQ